MGVIKRHPVTSKDFMQFSVSHEHPLNHNEDKVGSAILLPVCLTKDLMPFANGAPVQSESFLSYLVPLGLVCTSCFRVFHKMVTELFIFVSKSSR